MSYWIITTIKLPLETPIGVTTGFFLWRCPSCEHINELEREAHPAVEPAVLMPGIPSMFRRPSLDSLCTLICPCGVDWVPEKLAPYDRAVDAYQLLCREKI